MARDERIVLLGEDVPMVHAGLYARFGPERVMPTPISEAAFVGAAYGAALGGLRPVAECAALPNVKRIVAAARRLCEGPSPEPRAPQPRA